MSLDLPTLIQKVRLAAETKDAENEVQSATQRVGKTMQKFGVGMTAAVTVPIIALAGAGVKAASDLSESNSKVGVVFDENATKVRNFASTAATSLGISEQSALEATGTFGNLFRALGVGTGPAADTSTSLVTLAADLASFNNANPEDVLLALRSGLLGEAEPLRAFGVSLSAARIEAEAMSSGLVKATGDTTKIKEAQIGAEKATANAAKALKEHGKDSLEYRDAQSKATKAEEALSEAIKGKVPELTAAQKAQAAYAIIQKDTALAQGDFARTSEGLANKQRIVSAQFTDMKATLGTALLPVVQQFVGVLSEVFAWFGNLDPQGQKVVLILTGIAAAGGPLLIIGGKLVESFKSMVEGTKAVIDFGGKMAGKIGEVASSIADHASKIARSAADMASTIATKATDIAKAAGEMASRFASAAADIAVSAAKQAAEIASSAASIIAQGAKTVASYVVTAASAVASFVATAASAVASAAAVVAAWIVAAAPFILLGLVVAGVVYAIIKNWDTIKDVTAAVWEGIKDVISAVANAIWAVIQFVFNAIKAYFEFVLGVYVFIFKTAWEIIKAGVELAFDGAKAWFRGITVAADWVRDRVGDIIGFFTGIPGRIAGLAGSVADAAMGLGKRLMDGLVSGVKGAAGFVTDLVRTIQNAIAKVLNENIIDRINGVSVEILGKKIDFPNLPRIPMLAKGGPFDGPFIAGERGPELVIPNSSTSGTVVSNSRTVALLEQIAGGRSGGSDRPLYGSQVIHGLTPEQVTAATVRAHRQIALAWEVE